MENQLSHIDHNQLPTMVDVSHKKETERTARAQSKVWLPENIRELFQMDSNHKSELHTKKGPVFQTAIIAGTMAAKKTHDLIPFCHPLNLESIKFDLQLKGEYALIECQVKMTGKTGVEMEALTGVQVAALTIYDMCKALSHEIRIEDCRLLEKKGGKRHVL